MEGVNLSINNLSNIIFLAFNKRSCNI